MRIVTTKAAKILAAETGIPFMVYVEDMYKLENKGFFRNAIVPAQKAAFLKSTVTCFEEMMSVSITNLLFDKIALERRSENV